MWVKWLAQTAIMGLSSAVFYFYNSYLLAEYCRKLMPIVHSSEQNPECVMIVDSVMQSKVLCSVSESQLIALVEG